MGLKCERLCPTAELHPAELPEGRAALRFSSRGEGDSTESLPTASAPGHAPPAAAAGAALSTVGQGSGPWRHKQSPTLLEPLLLQWQHEEDTTHLCIGSAGGGREVMGRRAAERQRQMIWSAQDPRGRPASPPRAASPRAAARAPASGADSRPSQRAEGSAALPLHTPAGHATISEGRVWTSGLTAPDGHPGSRDELEVNALQLFGTSSWRGVPRILAEYSADLQVVGSDLPWTSTASTGETALFLHEDLVAASAGATAEAGLQQTMQLLREARAGAAASSVLPGAAPMGLGQPSRSGANAELAAAAARGAGWAAPQPDAPAELRRRAEAASAVLAAFAAGAQPELLAAARQPRAQGAADGGWDLDVPLSLDDFVVQPSTPAWLRGIVDRSANRGTTPTVFAVAEEEEVRSPSVSTAVPVSRASFLNSTPGSSPTPPPPTGTSGDSRPSSRGQPRSARGTPLPLPRQRAQLEEAERWLPPMPRPQSVTSPRTGGSRSRSPSPPPHGRPPRRPQTCEPGELLGQRRVGVLGHSAVETSAGGRSGGTAGRRPSGISGSDGVSRCRTTTPNLDIDEFLDLDVPLPLPAARPRPASRGGAGRPSLVSSPPPAGSPPPEEPPAAAPAPRASPPPAEAAALVRAALPAAFPAVVAVARPAVNPRADAPTARASPALALPMTATGSGGSAVESRATARALRPATGGGGRQPGVPSAALAAAKLQMQVMAGSNKVKVLARGFAEQQIRASSYMPPLAKAGNMKASPFSRR